MLLNPPASQLTESPEPTAGTEDRTPQKCVRGTFQGWANLPVCMHLDLNVRILLSRVFFLINIVLIQFIIRLMFMILIVPVLCMDQATN